MCIRDRYFTECRELGIPILPPDVNESQKNFNVVDKSIRFGLAAIKNVGVGAVESIIVSRETDGAFSSFLDFCSRIDLQKVNKRVLEGLIKVGAFDSIKAIRAQLMAGMDQVTEEAAAIQKGTRTRTNQSIRDFRSRASHFTCRKYLVPPTSEN